MGTRVVAPASDATGRAGSSLLTLYVEESTRNCAPGNPRLRLGHHFEQVDDMTRGAFSTNTATTVALSFPVP